MQEEEFRAREESLKRRDLELQDSMIRFSKFLQDNEAKRVRTVKKVTDERKLKETKEREIEEVVSPLLPAFCSWDNRTRDAILSKGATNRDLRVVQMSIAGDACAAKQPGTSKKMDGKDKRGTPVVHQVQNKCLRESGPSACSRLCSASMSIIFSHGSQCCPGMKTT